MATLYELKGEYQRLYEMAEECELELEDLQDTLESLDGEFEDKAVGYAMIMKEFDGQIDIIKKEVDRLKAKEQSLKKNKDRMKKALEEAMIETKNEKFKTDLFSFNIQNNPPTIELDTDYEIPDEYYIPQEPKLDKKTLIKDVKAGKEFKGVSLVQGRSLRIR
jgi:hypothetical protein